jgi:hypothetical protein
MDDLCAMQLVRIPADLKDNERASIMLNLYHLSILHGIFVIGPPASWVSWNTFFSTVSYKFSNQLISISEIETHLRR